ncbi:MAG TPA: nucleotidyl transferase AbiEii/AbiGii toxin family protein [Syntrophus sp. (in: bacteria)]|nr:nucleotidyl transferase AbiEii/AbiGii toxin family protein [Syntrophus sp. (in: bacteria)]
MGKLDFADWVKKSETEADKTFRQAIHSLMLAISKSDALQTRMIFHGGLLMAICFQGIRHTKDIDFVTEDKRTQIDEAGFVASLNEALAIACDSLPYGLDCRIQSYRVKPPGENRNFQSLKIAMGYAYKGTPGHSRLIRGESPTVVEIDYSFNEINQQIDTIELIEGGSIQAYSLPDLVGEKYRAMIQQKTRNRTRRQDAFDIYWLLKKGYLDDWTARILIYRSLLKKSESRGLVVTKDSLADAEIKMRSSAEYATLANEIEGVLPPFEEVYDAVREYYEALPWEK